MALALYATEWAMVAVFALGSLLRARRFGVILLWVGIAGSNAVLVTIGLSVSHSTGPLVLAVLTTATMTAVTVRERQRRSRSSIWHFDGSGG